MLAGAARLQVQLFHLGPGPRGFPEECQTGFDAGIMRKAAYINTPSHFFPSVSCNQVIQDGFQCHALQG